MSSKHYNLNEQVSTLTNIKIEDLNEFDISLDEILSYDIYDAVASGNDCAVIDTGYGKLKMKYENNEVSYSFKPSQLLDQYIRYSLTCKGEPLIHHLEKRVVESMNQYYKELL